MIENVKVGTFCLCHLKGSMNKPTVFTRQSENFNTRTELLASNERSAATQKAPGDGLINELEWLEPPCPKNGSPNGNDQGKNNLKINLWNKNTKTCDSLSQTISTNS